jgi:hypothetical protein
VLKQRAADVAVDGAEGVVQQVHVGVGWGVAGGGMGEGKRVRCER